jgi:hypothetical protein
LVNVFDPTCENVVLAGEWIGSPDLDLYRVRGSVKMLILAIREDNFHI